MKNIRRVFLYAFILTLSTHVIHAGPFDRFRERLLQLRGQSPAPVAAAPVAPPKPKPTFKTSNLGDTIWSGVLTLETDKISHYKNNKEQDYKITNPSVSAKFEIWFPSETTWLLVIDLSDARANDENDDHGIFRYDRRKWEPIIGAAPVGLANGKEAFEEDSDGDSQLKSGFTSLPLDAWRSTGTLDPNTNKFLGSVDNDESFPGNKPECAVIVNGSFEFVGSEAEPLIQITASSTKVPSKPDGPRVSNFTAKGALALTKRKVSAEKNQPGGFTDLPE